MAQFVRVATLQGHEDWVKSLAFQYVLRTDVLTLASGSQDGTIRLWNIQSYTKDKADGLTSDALTDALLDSFEASLGDMAEGEEGGRQISMKQHILTVKGVGQRSVGSPFYIKNKTKHVNQFLSVLRHVRCTFDWPRSGRNFHYLATPARKRQIESRVTLDVHGLFGDLVVPISSYSNVRR